MSTTNLSTERLPWTLRALNVIERVGNKLPHPFWLFWILAILLAITSAIMAAAGAGAVNPSDGEWTPVRNLISGEGLAMAFSGALDAYAGFPPLITIMVVIMGVALAEHTGMLETSMRMSIARVHPSLVVFVLAFIGTASTIASAAAYVILVPLGGLAFKAVGRSPILGIIVAYTSIASSYDANPIPSPNDAVFAGITTAAAQLIDPDIVVSPISNWYFNIASAVLLATVITIVTELFLSKRDNLEPDEGVVVEEIVVTDTERKALRWSLGAIFVALLTMVLLVAPPGSPLRGDGDFGQSPFMDGIAFFIALVFGVAGIAFGIRNGKIKTFGDVPKIMSKGIITLAPVLVFFFAISQFLAYFEWSNIGIFTSVTTSDFLRDLGAPIWVIFLVVIFFMLLLNVMITSGAAQWALTAPVIVPMLMLLDVPPETSQALFRISDSGSTSITPMSPYFLMALGFLQRYRKDAGIGTLASYTLPLAFFMTISWTLMFLAWWALGIPLGPGAPVR